MSDDSNATPTGDINELPQWGRDALTRANNEAADRRVALKKLTDQNTELNNQLATVMDSKTAAEKAATDKDLELQRVLIALDAGVPGERVRSIAARLQGSTEDELKADAQALLQDFGINAGPARATDPSQGRGNDAASVPNTPQAEFAQMFGQLDIFKR